MALMWTQAPPKICTPPPRIPSIPTGENIGMYEYTALTFIHYSQEPIHSQNECSTLRVETHSDKNYDESEEASLRHTSSSNAGQSGSDAEWERKMYSQFQHLCKLALKPILIYSTVKGSSFTITGSTDPVTTICGAI